MGQSPEEFNDFLNKNKDVVTFLRHVNEDNFTQLFELEGFKTIYYLKKLAENKEAVYLLIWIKEKFFDKLLELENIRTVDSLIKLINGKRYSHIKTFLSSRYNSDSSKFLKFLKLEKNYSNTYNIKV
jgi:NADH:ubiquinone oxidoreductase subunit C